ncbi:MAG: putative glycosyltransferase [Chloroflexi bacterium]|nr:MAG: putative glycosyltransferase [Chloroflexota bacterium]
MTPKPTCSIIIRAYNEEKHIRRLLTGISEQTLKNVQIILVDSGSTDHTIEETNGFQVELVKIQPHEFTFGRSLNLGIAHARADLVVIASAHVYPVYPDWLETLLEPFKDSQVALTYGKQRGSESTHFSESQYFHHLFPDHSTNHQAYPFCNNANAAIRRSLWEDHSYDELLPGLEDLAWGKWVQELGLHVNYVAEAEIIHIHNESTSGIFNRFRREGMAFKQIYQNEKFTKRDLVKLFVQNVISDWRAAIEAKKFSRNIFKIVRFRWSQFSGTYQGYKQSGPLTWQLKNAFYYPRLMVTHKKTKRDVDPIQYN